MEVETRNAQRFLTYGRTVGNTGPWGRGEKRLEKKRPARKKSESLKGQQSGNSETEKEM